MQDDCWDNEYRFALSYWLEKGEIEYLNARWDDALATFDAALGNAISLLDRCVINEKKSTLYRMKNDLRKALYVGLQGLEELGIHLDPFPEDAAIDQELERARALIDHIQWDTIEDLPELRDPEKLAAMALLRECFAPAYFLGSKLISIIGTRMTEIAITHGNSTHSGSGYIFFASITLTSDLKDFAAAYRMGKLALVLNAGKYGEPAHEALILDMWGTFVCHYSEPINNARDYLMRGYRSGIETGSYQWAGYCAMINLFMSFWGPETLGNVSENIDNILPGLEKIDPNMAQYYYAIKATHHNLTLETDDHCRLSKVIWPNARLVYERSREQNDMFTLLVITTCQLALANWFDERGSAAEFAEIGDKYTTGDEGVFLTPVFRFHQCLAYCGACEAVDEQKRQLYIGRIETTIRSFEHMGKHCPSTYLHQATLCKAELARVTGNVLEAMNLYDEAISSTRDGGFLQNEALANELAARFWLGIGKENISRIYFQEAAYRYRLWGAEPKARKLRSQYSDTFDAGQLAEPKEAIAIRTTIAATRIDQETRGLKSEFLDFTSVTKVAGSISREIDLDRLLDQIINTMIENAGAELGMLILEEDGELQIAAAVWTSVDGVESQAMSIDSCDNIARSMVNFVRRTGQHIVLDDATQDERFMTDPYVVERQLRSVLCLPLVNQTRQIGFVYLENNLISHAFNTDRLGVLRVLASQAAISLENSRIYEALSNSEKRFRKYFELGLVGIAITSPEKGWIEVNDKLCEIFGYTRGKLLQKTWQEITHPDDLAEDIKQYNRVLAGETDSYSLEKRFIKKNGNVIYSAVNINCLRLEDGSVAYFVTMVQDITDRKAAEEEARKYRNELAHVSRVSTMGEMATGIAHELNQPLAAITSYSFVAKSLVDQFTSSPQELREILGKLEDQTIRAGDIVRRLRDYVQKTESVRAQIDLNKLVREVITFVEPDINQAEVMLVLKFDDRSPAVLVDKIQMQQVLVNLIRNAIDAMREIPASQRKLTVSTRILQDGWTETVVCDSGKGLSQDELEKVYNAFYTTKQEGLGMGLAISRSIVEAHGGTLWAKPNSGPGVTFGFTIQRENGHGK